MPTTFNWISLGNPGLTLDPTEGNQVAEGAASFVGNTFGSAGAPLFGRVTSVTTIDTGGTAGALDMNNTVANDQFTTNPGAGLATFTFDGTAVFNATVTYADGTTATVTAVIAQDTAGNLYLAPDPAAGMDEAAYEAKPIQSLTLNSVAGDTYAGMGADRFVTGFDDGFIDGTAGGDLINGGFVEAVTGGSDRIDNGDAGLAGSAGNDDFVRAGAGNDSIYADRGNDAVYGGDGNDLAYGGDGADLVLGEGGQDTLHGDAGADTISGGSDNDQILGGADNDQLSGDLGQDMLSGGEGDDRIFGGDGNDTLAGGAGADLLDGGAGSDTADYSASGGGVSVNLLTGAGAGGDAAGDTLSGIETVLGGAGNDTLAGDNAANRLEGGAGNDTINISAGGDTVYGGDGADQIDDALANASTGSDLVYGGLGGDRIFANAGNDTLHGDEGDDLLHGEDGHDSLFGGDGNDTINAGPGNDSAYGGAGNDLLTGGAGSVLFEGGTGQDTISGGTGNGSLFGGDGNDSVTGNTGHDLLSGGAGNDTLIGGAGNDSLVGGDGNDTLAGGAGNDSFDGGTGQDNLDYSTSGAGVTVDLVAGTLTGGDATGDVMVSGIDGVIGSAFGDSLSGGFGEGTTGDIYTTQFYGLAGNDTLSGNGGGDLVFGGADQDLIFGGTGNDTLGGDDGQDTVHGDDGDDSLSGGLGDDRLYGGAGNDTLRGEGGSDTLYGSAGSDVMDGGGSGADAVDYSASGAGVSLNFVTGSHAGGDAAGDTLIGLTTVFGSGHDDTITGGTTNGNATQLYYGGAGNDRITGREAGSDTLFGGDGRDTLDGGAGNDVLSGDGGDDVLAGGLGSDSLLAGAGNDVVSDEVVGNTAGGGADTVELGDGQDVFVGSGRAPGDTDLVFGGLGNDTITVQQSFDTVYGGDGDDVIATVNEDPGWGDQLYGDAGNDAVTGANTNDRLFGGTGQDSLYGGGSTDTLDGGDGDDLLAGGAGADALIGGAGTDTADYAAAGSGVTVTLSGTGTAGDAAGDTLSEIENLTGSAFDDRLSGDAGANRLDGGAGHDVLAGHDGADDLRGGAGNDTLEGGQGADTLAGDGDRDLLRGGEGADSLLGGADRDTLQGGAGADVLTGGTGADHYVLEDVGGADRISDFDLADDDNDGFTNDQLDVSQLHNAQGDPVKSFDVAIGDDGFGNAVLQFPNGESVVLQGISPLTAALPGQLCAMGVPCFAGGTRIATPEGERPVESLGVGDRVLTRAGLAVPVLWHGMQALGAAMLENRPDLRPIRIEAGRFGARRALTLSPQHAVMIEGLGGPRLVRARHLAECGWGARVARGMRRVTYHHLLLPRHDVILAEGCPTESFYPGPMAVAALSAADRRRLMAAILGPDAHPTASLTAAYGPRCLPLVSRAEVRALRITASRVAG